MGVRVLGLGLDAPPGTTLLIGFSIPCGLVRVRGRGRRRVRG